MWPLKNKDFYLSPAWKRLRVRALERHGAVCMRCRSIEDIQVDHVKPRSLFPRLRLKLSNLQILCGDCNKKKGQKSNDYRPVGWKGYYYMISLIKKIVLVIVIMFFGRLVWIDVAYHPFESTVSSRILSEAQEIVSFGLTYLDHLITDPE